MVKVAVLGATGYAGADLVRLLYNHPGVELVFLSSERYAGTKFSQVHPQFEGLEDQRLCSLQVGAIPEETAVVFCALPHGKSAPVIPELLQRNLKVIDLSADFRLNQPSLYEQWYGWAHPAPGLLASSVYGLPEVYAPAAIRQARLVANPGCFPTGAILALAPLSSAKLVDWGSVIIDAKSGVSGAGRTPGQGFHFPDCTENFKAYRVGDHQHTPEIEQELARLAGEKKVRVTFTPHLVPMIRGILSTVYINLPECSLEELYDLYEDFYRESVFVRVRREMLPETRLVRGSNYCDLALRVDQRAGRLIIISCIDNLVKGASGQAVQNMNILLGYPQEKGLIQVPL
ncbi:MAG TPA: N-acetyl-gamma-glutamyl-phosphate reductase [Firmicutes bacterium]|nr:N-acetyl-gamma-glutamyl-phosphate reductase [Bacillota bacterium]